MISLESCLFYNECYIGYIFFESFAPIKGGKTKILKKSKNHYIQPKATSAHQCHDYWMFTWGAYAYAILDYFLILNLLHRQIKK